LENTYFLLGVLSFLDLSDENKDYITKGIIKGTIELMESTITSQTLQQRSKRFTKPRFQSKNSITKDNFQYNILSGTQILPARPRDFRKNLEEEERNIDKHELSDIFSTPILKNLITRKKGKYPFKRGRPNSDLDEERRGAFSYFEKTEFLQIIEIILRDSERLKQIDDIITNEKIYEDFLKYSNVLKIKVKEENEIAFRNIYKPIKQRDENKNTQSIQKNNNTLDRQELNILYEFGTMMFFNSLLLSQSD
jgi:hypothetical protein